MCPRIGKNAGFYFSTCSIVVPSWLEDGRTNKETERETTTTTTTLQTPSADVRVEGAFELVADSTARGGRVGGIDRAHLDTSGVGSESVHGSTETNNDPRLRGNTLLEKVGDRHFTRGKGGRGVRGKLAMAARVEQIYPKIRVVESLFSTKEEERVEGNPVPCCGSQNVRFPGPHHTASRHVIDIACQPCPLPRGPIGGSIDQLSLGMPG